MSSLGTPGSLGDPALRLLGPSGALFGSNADSGAGFDATLTFTAATSGSYTVELSATGVLTGSYAFQAAVVGGAAMQSGNSYTVSNALTLVSRGAGALARTCCQGQRVSYGSARAARSSCCRPPTPGQDGDYLTGNEFGQTSSACRRQRDRRQAGADVLTEERAATLSS